MTASASRIERIGLFGGSFNPPHLAHLIVAEFIREQFELDAVLWIPSNQTPLKRPEDLASAADRLEMTRLAIAGNEHFRLSDIETGRTGVSYTVDTIRMLQDQHPAVDYRLIIGADSMTTFSAWLDPEEILRRVPVVVFPRRGADVSPRTGFEGRVTMADAPRVDISGTMIRERLLRGLSIRYLVPETVKRYIDERRLYRGTE